MKKWQKTSRFIVSITLILLLIQSIPASIFVFAADNYTIKHIRVGLSYGSGALPSVNALTNLGYNIGYFDANDNFVEVAKIPNHFVTFGKDKPLYISSNTVSDVPNGGKRINPCHLQIDTSYPTYDAALSYLSSVKSILAGTGLSSIIFPAYIDGAYYVRIGEYDTTADATADLAKYQTVLGASLTAVGMDIRTITVIDMNEDVTVFEIALSTGWPAVCPQQNGTSAERLKNGSNYFRGYFEFKRLAGEDITFISVVSLQEYVKGVVPYEIGVNAPLEAMKAQAIVARNYAAANINKHQSSGFNLCATTDCQAYKGCGYENENISKAVDETNGYLLTYNGAPIEAFYHSSNGGYTVSNADAWGGTARPYYSAVPDPYENLSTAINGTWCKTATSAELTTYLQSKKIDIGEIVSCYVSKFTTPGNNVYEITFVDKEGKKKSVSKTDATRIFLNKYVYSPNFCVETVLDAAVNEGTSKLTTPLEKTYSIGGEGVKTTISDAGSLNILTADGKFTPASDKYIFQFRGKGWGHNVGMSQNGAMGMANAGMTVEQILPYYFQGTQIEVFNSLKN